MNADQFWALVKFAFSKGDVRERLIDALGMVYEDQQKVAEIMDKHFPDAL